MRFFVGTSGYGYKEWKGTFYPAKLPQKEMLSFYAQRFSTVEVNNTFYRMPSASDVESWAQQVPDSFRFVLKAPQTITHRKRLKTTEEETDRLLRTAAVLKERQGPAFFQLPPNLKKDLPRLAAFLGFWLVGRRRPSSFGTRVGLTTRYSTAFASISVPCVSPIPTIRRALTSSARPVGAISGCGVKPTPMTVSAGGSREFVLRIGMKRTFFSGTKRQGPAPSSPRAFSNWPHAN